MLGGRGELGPLALVLFLLFSFTSLFQFSEEIMGFIMTFSSLFLLLKMNIIREEKGGKQEGCREAIMGPVARQRLQSLCLLTLEDCCEMEMQSVLTGLSRSISLLSFGQGLTLQPRLVSK